MFTPSTHLISNWPIYAAMMAGLALAIAAVRYKLPELARRISVMEDAKHPTKDEMTLSLDGFQVTCKLNQVSCQKATAGQISAVKTDLNEKFTKLVDMIHKQAITIARIDERIGTMHRNDGHADKAAK